MFSGKSEELIKRVKVLQYAKANILILKPMIDSRGDATKIMSRNGTYTETKVIKNVNEIDQLLNDKHEVLIIDEAQFLTGNIADYCNKKSNEGLKIIISGLDQDYKGVPFGPIPKLLSFAEFVTKLTAICFECHNAAATMTYRKSKTGQVVQIGDLDDYEARCRSCHVKGMKEN
jgi:thymidine kinase